jgi:hypothetical protein
MINRPNYIDIKHWNEWLESTVHPGIIAFNVISPSADTAFDRTGTCVGSGRLGERFWNSPAIGFQAPSFSSEKEKNMYFQTRSARNTASLLQAPQFMDGVSPLLPSNSPLPVVDYYHCLTYAKALLEDLGYTDESLTRTCVFTSHGPMMTRGSDE